MMKIGQRIFKDIKKFWPIPIIAVVLYVLLHKLRGACCPAVLLLGLPCPGCGTVRASLYVLKGQFAQAFYMNPTVYLWIAFLLYVIVVRYILGKPLKHRDSHGCTFCGWNVYVLSDQTTVFVYERKYTGGEYSGLYGYSQ